MVHDSAIRFLRQVFIKAAVSGFHMKNRYLKPLRRNSRQGGIGIAQYQKGVRLNFLHKLIAFGNDVADGLSQIIAYRIQIVIRLAKPQVLKENLIEGVIPVLARMGQNMVKIYITFFNNLRKTDDLRSRSDNRK